MIQINIPNTGLKNVLVRRLLTKIIKNKLGFEPVISIEELKIEPCNNDLIGNEVHIDVSAEIWIREEDLVNLFADKES